MIAMIDIHCHILPSLDDGAKDLSESLAMAEAAVKEGIHTIIATPHYKNNLFENKSIDILGAVEELGRHLKEANIPLTLLPGQEPRISGEFLSDVANQEILTLANTKYLFIELPNGHVPRYTEQLLFDIQLEGLIPIIVHPERNTEIIEQPDLLYRFVKKGALTQVTAASITGAFGKKIRRFSFDLIENQLTHFIASDAHNLTNRSFHMKHAFKLVEAMYGIEMVYLYKENAQRLVAGQNVMKDIPQRIRRKKVFGIF